MELLCSKKQENEEKKEGEMNFEYKKDYVVRCLNANKHNHITTSYYLLLKKYQGIENWIDNQDFRYYDEKAVLELVKNSKKELTDNEKKPKVETPKRK